MKKQLSSFDKKVAISIDCIPNMGWMWKWEGKYSKKYFKTFEETEKDLRNYLSKI